MDFNFYYNIGILLVCLQENLLYWIMIVNSIEFIGELYRVHCVRQKETKDFAVDSI